MLFHIICVLPLFIGFVTRLTRRMSLVEQKLLTLPEYLSSSPVFSGVRVTRSFVLYVCFVDRRLPFCSFSFGHCVVCSSLIYGLWLPLWYLLCCLFFDIRIMITPLVSFGLVLSVLLRYTDYDYPFGIFWPCVVCSSSIYGLRLPLWYLLAIVLSVLRYTDYDYPFDIFWP